MQSLEDSAGRGHVLSTEEEPPGLPQDLKALEERVRQARERKDAQGWNKRPEHTADDREGRRTLALAFRIGTELVAALIVGGGGGLLVDDWLGTRPWGLIVMFVLGAAAGVVNVYRAVSGIGYAPGYGGSAGDHSAQGDLAVTFDPNHATRAVITFRVVSNDDPLGAVRIGAPILDGLVLRTPPREDFSDRGIGKDVSASVIVDLTRINPGRYPLVFTTKETNCSQCLSVAHVVTMEVTRRCPKQGTCATKRATYDDAVRAYNLARASVHTAAATASRNYLRLLGQQRACLKNHANPSACNSIELAADGPCPDLALGATAAQCTRIRSLQAAIAPAQRRMEAAWSVGVNMQCCLFDCRGGRADQPWVTYTPGTSTGTGGN